VKPKFASPNFMRVRSFMITTVFREVCIHQSDEPPKLDMNLIYHITMIVVLENVKNMRLPRSSHIRFANSQRKDNKVFIHVELPWETSCLSLTDCFFSISRHVSDCDHFKYVFVLTTWERSSAFEHIAYTDCDTQTPPL